MNEKFDALNRDSFINKLETLVEMLAENGQGCCFGIDGAWGSGKSFVLEKFESRIKDIISEETADNKYFVFHYDCWKYDYYEEPAIAIISAMLDVTDREISVLSEKSQKTLRLAWETTKETLKTIAGEMCKNKLGIDYVEIASEALKKQDETAYKEFDSLYGFKRALEAAREGIQKIAKNKTVVIVVDELDRCLPTYSIKVLERLHHIFNELQNVIVIVSMDKSQLAHSIQGIYGNIEVDVYLRKFISFKMDLSNGIVNSYKEKYLSYFSKFDITESECEELERFFSSILLGLDMRTQERIFRKAEIVHTIIKSEIEMDSSIIALEILFITVALKTKTKDLRWLAEVPLGHDYGREEQIGRSYYNMLVEYGKQGVSDFTRDGGYIANNGMMGRTLFLLSSMFYECKFGRCGKVYYHFNDIKESMELVRLFKGMVDVIDSD